MLGLDMMLKSLGITPDIIQKTQGLLETGIKLVEDIQARQARIEAKLDALAAASVLVTHSGEGENNGTE